MLLFSDFKQVFGQAMTTLRKISIGPYLALAAGIICIGFSGIFVSWANAPGSVTGFYRMAIAALVLAWPFSRRLSKLKNISRSGIFFAILGGVLFAGDLVFWNTGVLISGAVNPTLMGNTAPLWVALGALFLFREKLRPAFWFGLILAMTGAAIILGADALQDISLGLGTFLGLLAGIFYGGYFLVTQRGRDTLDSITYFWIAAVSAAVLLLILSLAMNQPIFGYSTPTYLSFLGLGLIVQVFGQFAISHSLGILPASFVAPAGLGQPVVTALLAGPLLSQFLSPFQILGGIAVLIGIFIIHRSRRNQQEKRVGR